MRGSRILACRNIAGGYCYLPGGHVEFGERATDALRREILEETGLEVRVGPCVLVAEVIFDDAGRRRHELNLVFHVEHAALRPGDDAPSVIASREAAVAFEWLDLAALPNTDLRPPAIRAWLASGMRTDQDHLPCIWIATQDD